MSDYADLSDCLVRSLALATRPVAVTFSRERPPDVREPSGPVPAGCSFWELGSRQTLATSAKHHEFCSIGIHTHNLANAPPSYQHELETALGAMQGLDYVRPAEVEALPVMALRNEHVVYGPLEDATKRPSVVLIFATAAQGLVLAEAVARVDGKTPPAMGRPACALIPQVLNSSQSGSSLGCCGARAYLDVLADDITVWGLLGERLEQYVLEVERLSKANSVLRRFHELRLAAIESGDAPTVEQSLQALD